MIRTAAALKEHIERGGVVELTAAFDLSALALVDPSTDEIVHRQALNACVTCGWAAVTRTDLAGEPMQWGRP